MIVGFLGGILLGIIFFGGLYWSVNQLTKVRYPAALMIVSALVRMGIILFGVYLLADNNIKNILAILIGIILVKVIMIFTVQKKSAKGELKE
ncbi:MAG: ATP synthase subunit I [Dethiosulfatibacter sp.]|nr:ATP synthase subunit I [Dethiosulfatibacter sp.]